MMESLDEQLARLDAEHQQKQAHPSSLQSDSFDPDDGLDDLIEALARTRSQPASSSAGESQLDETLAQVESEQQQKTERPSASSPNVPLEERLDEITSQVTSRVSYSASQDQGIDNFLAEVESAQGQKSSADSGLDHVLTDITANLVTRSFPLSPSQQSQTTQNLKQIASQYRPQDVAQALQNLEQRQEEQRLDAKRQQRKREALRQKAREWLKNLDPHSEEGLWFEEFAYAYDSKLDAAMDYLSALGEVS